MVAAPVQLGTALRLGWRTFRSALFGGILWAAGAAILFAISAGASWPPMMRAGWTAGGGILFTVLYVAAGVTIGFAAGSASRIRERIPELVEFAGGLIEPLIERALASIPETPAPERLRELAEKITARRGAPAQGFFGGMIERRIEGIWKESFAGRFVDEVARGERTTDSIGKLIREGMVEQLTEDLDSQWALTTWIARAILVAALIVPHMVWALI